MKWLKSENLQQKLLFLDINSAYVDVAANMEFPVGKLEILIHRDLEDVVYKNGLLVKEKTNKELQGLIKLMVLQNSTQEPFFIVKGKENGKEQTYHVLCIKCLRKKKQEKDPCTLLQNDREGVAKVKFLSKCKYEGSIPPKITQGVHFWHF